MEQDVREAAGVSRGQNVVYVMPHDPASIAQFLAPLIERVEDGTRELQLLVIASDAEVAALTAAAAVKLAKSREVGIVAATSARRAQTLLRASPAQIVTGTAEVFVELLKAASLKLDTVRAVCIVWADELVMQGAGAAAALETLMAELPKDGARVVVASELSEPVEHLLERYARRARRVAAPAHESDEPVRLEYVTVSRHSRLSNLRRLLDHIDPRSATVFVRDDESIAHVADLLRALGYDGAGAAVTTGLAPAAGVEVIILFDLPASRAELREAVGAAQRSIALIQPRQLVSLRSLAAGGDVTPFTLSESGLRARDRDEQIRMEIRGVLVDAQFGRNLLALEPLLDEFDGIEVAAATLHLLDRERSANAALQSAVPSAKPDRSSASMTRLFVSVGSRDNVKPGDLVGAIANQAGVTSASIGKVDVRESHSVVEVSADIAELVIEKVTGTEIRGRRAIVRRDIERESRDRGGIASSRGGRDAKRGPPRARDAGDRSSSSRPPRAAGRPPRTGDRE